MRAELTDLGDGVTRVTMPLPWALDHVHCYAVAGGDGWTIIDAGPGSGATLRWWEDALAEMGDAPVRRLVITHYHPDHIGASAGLVELTGADEVVQGSHDAHLTELAWGADADVEGFRRHLEIHGMPPEMAAQSTDAEERTPVHAAVPTRLVDPGDELDLDGERFRVLVLPGHADGHIALHGERTGRLFGGDVLLEEITPNVGRWPDTAPDPLGAYLRTLGEIDRLAPTRVLPGHGPVIDDARRRTEEIRAHHAERLDAHVAALRTGASSAYDVARVVWAQDGLGFHEQRFALVEALSHLERLEAEGRAEQVEPARWVAT
jgi:glyoxylase-like metal-dependent hydrolase (beta-lactamase superfamily II)